MRAPFTDEWNSFWHVVFGLIAVPIPIVIPIFLLYQFVLKYDENSIIDTLEFAVGYCAYMASINLKVFQKFRIHLN